MALLVYGPAIIVLHELGHAAFARLGGYRVTHFSVGQGGVLLRLGQFRGAQLWVGRWLLSGGQCSAIPLGPVSPKRGWFHAGGLIVQAFLGGALLLMPQTWWMERVATFNALVAMTNAVPWRIAGSASDGWRLWELWRGGRRQIEILPQRRALLHALSREQDVGSPLGIAWVRLGLVWGDAIAGAPPMDLEFVRDLPSVLFSEPYLAAVTRYVLVESHRRAGDLQAAHDVFATGQRPSVSTSAEAALTALAQAGLSLQQGDGDAVRTQLDAAFDGPPLMRRQASVLMLERSLLQSADDVERATWGVVRHTADPWLDPVAAAAALQAAAKHLAEQGRREAATGVQRAAETLAERTLATTHRDHDRYVRRRLASA